MSELKATTVYDAYWNANSTGQGTGVQVYLKSEADKVIANRDYEIEKLKESISNLLKMKTEQVMVEVMKKALIYGEGFVSVEHTMKIVSELLHYKYNRCLDQAKLCERLYFEFRDLLYSTYNVELEHVYNIKIEHYYKWNRRWLELAEKFKEAK